MEDKNILEFVAIGSGPHTLVVLTSLLEDLSDNYNSSEVDRIRYGEKKKVFRRKVKGLK